jgi:phosphate:Na+ symporter
VPWRLLPAMAETVSLKPLWSVVLPGLAGGVLLFFVGLNILASSLKSLGEALKRVPPVYMKSPLRSFLIGTAVTAIIQSSSAVAMVDAGLLPLETAIAVVLGANVGTTITAHFASLNLLFWATISFVIGFSLICIKGMKEVIGTKLEGGVFKDIKIRWYGNKRRQEVGEEPRATAFLIDISIGIGVILLSLEVISRASLPLLRCFQIEDAVISPFTGVLWGTLITGLIQSSSVVTAIIAFISGEGGFSVDVTFPIILGANIGTCVTAMIAALGRSRAARQAALAHFLINCIGVAAALCLFDPLVCLIRMTGHDAARLVANAHTIFNVFNAAIVWPFLTPLSRFTRFLVKENRPYIWEFEFRE